MSNPYESPKELCNPPQWSGRQWLYAAYRIWLGFMGIANGILIALEYQAGTSLSSVLANFTMRDAILLGIGPISTVGMLCLAFQPFPRDEEELS